MPGPMIEGSSPRPAGTEGRTLAGAALRLLGLVLAMAAVGIFLGWVMSHHRPDLADGFYAPTEALCRTGSTAVDRGLDRPQVGRAANAQKVAFDSRYPGRLIIDNSEICYIVSDRSAPIYVKCSYGGDAKSTWRYGYHENKGVIYLDQRAFKYCGPIDGQGQEPSSGS